MDRVGDSIPGTRPFDLATSSPRKGLDRREFVKTVTMAAAAVGLSSSVANQIVEAAAKDPRKMQRMVEIQRLMRGPRMVAAPGAEATP